MLELKELKRLNDKAYTYSQTTRERASDDMVFYWVTHWSSDMLQDSQLAYRGEFDVLRKAGRDVMSSIKSNPVQVDFEPKDATRDDAAELLDGIYRNVDSHNYSINAYENAANETIVCGMGAWEIYTEYETIRGDSEHQVIKRRPIYEANNCVLFDPNAKLLDKSDAEYAVVLASYTPDGYRRLVEDLTGEDPGEVSASDFSTPQESYSFPWLSGKGEHIYIANFYHRKKVKDKILTLENPYGQTLKVREKSLVDVMDELIDAGFEVLSEKTVERYEVRKYICSGKEIIFSDVIPGEHIPVVPMYGEYARIEGEEHYEGITRLAKDPQRLRDFQLSYLADIVSRSPRRKPIFLAEQIEGFETMYSENGADNNYPYLLQNRLDKGGQPLPIGPVGEMPEQPMPQALIASIALSKESIEDVANAGLPQNIADPDLSGKAVLALQNKIDQQSMVYQEHLKHAKRRDGEIFASIAAEIFDVAREVTITKPDGSRDKARVMEVVYDRSSGKEVVLNDVSNAEFDVYSTISASYSSQKEQTLDRLMNMLDRIPPTDPMHKAVLLKSMILTDGTDFDDIREYANKQLVMSGFKEPETEEEIAMMQQLAQQGQEPSAEMVLAQAEMVKGQAADKEANFKMVKLQYEMQNEGAKRQVDGFKAETDRISVQVDAQEAGATISMKEVEKFGKQLDNQTKIRELQKPENMTTEELYQQFMAG